jgi:hypothetical protein
MKRRDILCLVALSVMALMLYLLYLHYGMCYVRANNGRYYFVKDLSGKNQVAEILARLETHGDRFVAYCKTSAYRNDPRIQNLVKRWNGTLSETSSHDSKEAGYTLNKRHVSLCIRNEQGNVEDFNSSVFVLLHEMTHVASDTIGHHVDFWRDNKFILHLADQAGFYTYKDFEKEPTNYCGHRLSSNPLSCVKDGSCSVE